MAIKVPAKATQVEETPVPVPTKKRQLPMVADSPPPSVAGIIDEVLKGRNTEVQFFRPSMVSACTRANVYHYMKAPTNPPNTSPVLHRILDTGTALHEVVQKYIGSHYDVLFAPEVRVHDPHLSVKGSCDGVLIERATGYRWAIEIKTIGDSGYKKLTGPKPEHIEQATIYMALLGVRWCSFLYVNKNTQVIREFLHEFQPEVWEGLRERLLELKAYAEEGRTPPFSSKECLASIDLCRYVGHCQDQRGITSDDEE
jgi:hypothetical protein